MILDFDKKNSIEKTKEFQIFSDEFKSNIEFLENFSDLVQYNGHLISFITDKNVYHINTHLLDNSIKTLKSIILCCSIGSFTDANTLIRKLRDDLLLFVYILDVVNKRIPFIQEDIENLSLENVEDFTKSFSNIRFNNCMNNDEKAVEAWLSNTILELPRNIRMKLSFENYMKVLKQNDNINRILTYYNLQNYWEALGDKLNNYVHNNGRQFTTHNLIRHNDQNLEVYLKNINIRASYITTLFLVLITMVEASLISSSDIVDYLDEGIEPPEDCQYEIASFIQEFIDKKVVKLHPELKQYLKDNNNYGMKIQ